MHSSNSTQRHAILPILVFLALISSLLLVPVAAQAQSDTDVVIHKTQGEGDTPGMPLSGITFEVLPVIGATSADTESLVAEMKTNPMLDGHQLGAPIKAVSNSQGDALFPALPDAIYLVREIPSRVGNVAYSVISPFLIGLPQMATTQANGAQTLTVYAKNQPLAISITSTPQDSVRPGSSVMWHIQSNVPAPDRNGLLHNYVLVSRLDSALQYEGVNGLVITDGSSTLTLDPNADYTVAFDPATNSVVVKLTPSGLAKLAAMRFKAPQTNVMLDIKTTVRPDTPQGAVVKNEVQLFPDGWPVNGSAGVAIGAVSDVSNVTVVAPSPTPSPATPQCPPQGCEASVISVILAKTGAYLKEIIIGAVGFLVVGFVLFFIARKRRKDDAEPAVDSPNTTAENALQKSSDEVIKEQKINEGGGDVQ
ncbi:fimbrial isopeptide formation D2 family protein [Arcanobacterium pluranimalium]|uniref:isopeptide-forming domain-containing fimbrial protein n=1 Tax=Arcanobacterium pluranimalium TaxID=108028 RepID=UPI00195686F0|nr:isopeptide-forming domain-containing fimbrial protein [Arcanobacterium pluranimalium]MBM7825911.1 fimbrial isopeptide formation D2 family protein [Arcanobacterium pluranimalium]